MNFGMHGGQFTDLVQFEEIPLRARAIEEINRTLFTTCDMVMQDGLDR